MANKTFNIEVTMDERWIDNFCSMLKYMEGCGKIGQSKTVGLYSDGDGDFRPEFKIDTEFSIVDGKFYEDIEIDKFYDAG